MANRLSGRRLLISIPIAIFIIFILFIGPNSQSRVRTPSPLGKTDSSPLVKDELTKGEVVMPRLGNETAKAELGRATWKYFHTMLARYPEDPTEEQQETLRSFIYLFARLYPCGECASHFQQHLKKYPPQVASRNTASSWGCFIHNEVNAMLDKPEFDCKLIGDAYDCGCADDEETDGEGKEVTTRNSVASEPANGGDDQTA